MIAHHVSLSRTGCTRGCDAEALKTYFRTGARAGAWEGRRRLFHKYV